MITLQSMLLQTGGDQLLLLPAWPREWNADFKLDAPLNTNIHCVYRDGRIQSLTVTPQSRAKDIILAQLSPNPAS